MYRLTDCNGNTAEANVTLNFQPQPTAKDDVYEYNGEPFTKTTNVGVLANDASEGSTEPLTAKLKTQALNGFVSLSRDGAFTYSPSTDLRASGSSNESVQAASADVTPSAGSDVTTMQGADSGLYACDSCACIFPGTACKVGASGVQKTQQSYEW